MAVSTPLVLSDAWFANTRPAAMIDTSVSINFLFLLVFNVTAMQKVNSFKKVIESWALGLLVLMTDIIFFRLSATSLPVAKHYEVSVRVLKAS